MAPIKTREHSSFLTNQYFSQTQSLGRITLFSCLPQGITHPLLLVIMTILMLRSRMYTLAGCGTDDNVLTRYTFSGSSQIMAALPTLLDTVGKEMGFQLLMKTPNGELIPDDRIGVKSVIYPPESFDGKTLTALSVDSLPKGAYLKSSPDHLANVHDLRSDLHAPQIYGLKEPAVVSWMSLWKVLLEVDNRMQKLRQATRKISQEMACGRRWEVP